MLCYDPSMKTKDKICPTCKGDGFIPPCGLYENRLIYCKAHKCYDCNATGKIPDSEQEDIKKTK